MKTSGQSSGKDFRSEEKDAAFTLVELLAVLGACCLLLLTVLPVLAGPREKSTRVQCAANLRQLHVASMHYANEYGGWLPLWRAGVSGQNNMSGSHHSRYVYNGPIGWTVPKSPNPLPPGGALHNTGYLYWLNLVGDGHILYCPTMTDGPFSAAYYSPPLTPDSSGVVRSAYLYNPRTSLPSSTLRRYQKTTDLEPHKLFMVDVIAGITYLSHLDERGWNVLFADGSVAFSRDELAYTFVANGNYEDPTYLNLIFDQLERER